MELDNLEPQRQALPGRKKLMKTLEKKAMQAKIIMEPRLH